MAPQISTVIDLLVLVTAVELIIPVNCFNVSSFFAVELVFVGNGSLSTAGELPEPISSMRTVFNGFCVCNNLN